MKNLEKFGVETLNTQEMRETDGGIGFWGSMARDFARALSIEISWDAAEGVVNEIIEDVKVGWNNPK